MRKIVLGLLIVFFTLTSCENKITNPRIDYEKSRQIISEMIMDFFHMFEKLMYLNADDIVKDFTPSCRGYEHQKRTILNHQANCKEDPFILKINYYDGVSVGYVDGSNAYDVRLKAQFVAWRWRDGFQDEVICTHIYTCIVENYRWWICDYKVKYETGSKALFYMLFEVM